AHHLGRTPAHAANDIELEYAVWRLDAAVEECDRIAADHHGNGHALTALEIFFAVNPAVMALGHHNADGFLVMHLRPIGAGVKPFFLRVHGDAVGAGADVASAVLLVPDRGGELGDVDVIPHHDVLEHRTVIDDLMRDDLLFLQVCFAITVGELP